MVEVEEGVKSHLRRNVTAMTVGNTAIVSLNALWIMFMPFYFTDLGIDVITLEMLFTIFLASSAIASPFGGGLADRFGRKPTLLLGYTI